MFFVICSYSNPISLVWGQLHACLSIVFIWCTYMIFWHCTVNNGHINLQRLWHWTTLSQWWKSLSDSLLSQFCCKFGLILIFRKYLHVSYNMHFEAMSEIITFHSATQKTIYLPQYVYVNWSKIIFMNQNWVITVKQPCFLWYVHIQTQYL